MAEVIIHDATLIKSAEVPMVSLAPLGGDPLTQIYEEETGDYLPDRTVLPLTLVALVTINGDDCSDQIVAQGWYQVIADGTEQQISSSTAGFSLVSPATGALRLQVLTNTPSTATTKLVYRCTVGRMKVASEIILRTEIAASPGPTLEIDASSAIVWNPFEDSSRDVMKITPTVRDHGHTGLTVNWLKIEDGVPRVIDPDDPKDIECSFDGDAIKVNRRWMGEVISLVAVLMKGSAVCDRKYVSIKRRIPGYECRVIGSKIFTEEDSSVYRTMLVKLDKTGILNNPSQELLISWYENNVVVGTGNAHSYSTKGKLKISSKVTIEDRGCLKLAAFGGKYLTIDGKFLLIR